MVSGVGSNEKIHRLFRLERKRIRIFAINETGANVAGEDEDLFLAYEPIVNRILMLYFFAWIPSSISLDMFIPRSNQEIRPPSILD
jgi:hypothetical protein